MCFSYYYTVRRYSNFGLSQSLDIFVRPFPWVDPKKMGPPVSQHATRWSTFEESMILTATDFIRMICGKGEHGSTMDLSGPKPLLAAMLVT